MPNPPEKWDYLDGLHEALDEFRGIRGVTDEIVDITKRWYDTRELDPLDGHPLPTDRMHEEEFAPWRADVRDLDDKAVLVDGRQVVCFYKIYNDEGKVVCSHFALM